MSDPARPDDDTSSSLLVRVKNRDPDACLRLVEWIGPFILSWCRRAGLQPADRDEVSQQALLNVWGRLAAFRKEKPGDSFRGWVYSITRSRILDLWVRAAGRPTPAVGRTAGRRRFLREGLEAKGAASAHQGPRRPPRRRPRFQGLLPHRRGRTVLGRGRAGVGRQRGRGPTTEVPLDQALARSTAPAIRGTARLKRPRVSHPAVEE